MTISIAYAGLGVVRYIVEVLNNDGKAPTIRIRSKQQAALNIGDTPTTSNERSNFKAFFPEKRNCP